MLSRVRRRVVERLRGDAREDLDHLIGVADQIGLAVDHHAAQLAVDRPVLDQQRHARIALDVPDLLALGEGRHHDRAVRLHAVPHRHRVRRAVPVDRSDDDRLRLREEVAQLGVGHLDLVRVATCRSVLPATIALSTSRPGE
jgi:hypothetical protein